MTVSIGVSFPESIVPGAPLPDIAGLTGLAEQVGLDGVWVGDRLAVGELSVLDSALSLAAAAAVTSSIAIGYAVYVPSLRPLAWAAKQVATLQHIAGGRLQLGVAIGGGSDAEYLAAGFRRSDRAGEPMSFSPCSPARWPDDRSLTGPVSPAAARSGSCRRCRCRRCGSAGLPFRRCAAPSGSAPAGCPDCRRRASSRPAASGCSSFPTRPGGPGR